MRVGVFTNNYLPIRGGVTTSVETLADGLRALGHHVSIFAPRFSGHATDAPGILRFPSLPAL